MEEDQLKAFVAVEAQAVTGEHYSDHRVISIHKIWEARAAGLPDPEWPLAPGAMRKPTKRVINRDTGADYSRRLSAEDIDYILTSGDTMTQKARRLNVQTSTIKYHLARGGLA